MGAFIGGVGDVIVLVVLFSATIFVHEFCHFITALRLGLVVDVFSIGFGPALWQRKHKGIVYKIGMIPFGGYVALPQLDPAGMEAIQGEAEPKKKPGFFRRKAPAPQESQEPQEPARHLPDVSPWRRIAVAVAGVAGNMALAVVLAWVVYLAPEDETGQAGTVIGFVATNSPAYGVGLRPGDQIVAVNGEGVTTWNDFMVLCAIGAGRSNEVALTVSTGGAERVVRTPTRAGSVDESLVEGLGVSGPCLIGRVRDGSPASQSGVRDGDIALELDGVRIASPAHFIDMVAARADREVALKVRRQSAEVDLRVTPRFDEAAKRALIGVELTPAEIGGLPWMQYRKPWDQIRSDASGILRILKALVTPKESRRAAGALGGPVVIMTWLWLSIKISIFNAVGFLRFLNVNLAILNLLPFPVLDGGHIVFCLWEGITRRRAHPRLVNVLVNAFAVLLIGVFVILTFRDLMRLPRMLKGIRALEAAEREAGTNDAPAVKAETNAQRRATDPAP